MSPTKLDEQISAFLLADRDVRMERLELVTMSVSALGMDPVWTDLGDTGRRRLARRLQFQRWRMAELYAPFDRLGNRVEVRL